jgi:hypothetical protein
MNAARQFRPCVEQLDNRTLPSVSFGAGWLPAVAEPGLSLQSAPRPALVQHTPAPHRLLRLGLVSGTWTNQPTLPDTGKTQDLEGSGVFFSLGQVQMSGRLHTPGFVLQGRTTGTLVLSNARGSITLELVGPLQSGFSPPPSAFQYTITGGTGAYAGLTGQGTATLLETSGNFSMTFVP